MSHLIEDIHFSYFTSLESLTLIEMKSLENIVPMHALTIPFEKLQTIELSYCEQLKNLFSFSIFKGLSNLQEIKISGCGMMDEIVFVENEEPTNQIECSHLNSLILYDVERLTSFCSKQSIHKNSDSIIPFFDDQVSFPNLKVLSIQRGANFEILWHKNGLVANSFCKLQNIHLDNCNKLRYVFPSTMMTSLVSLKTLNIESCNLLERIFEIEKPTFQQNDDTKIVPLTKLELFNLPNLKYVWDKDPDEFLIFPNLNEVDVDKCPQLRNLFPASFIKYLQQVRNLRAHDVAELFPEDTTSNLVSFPEIFPSLISLAMDCKLAVKASFWVRSELFVKLESLVLTGSDDDNMITFPLELSGALYNTKELGIRNTYQLVHIFGNEEENNQRHGNLKRLYLENIPKLTYVWRDSNEMTTRFDRLEIIEVMNCDNLKCLLPSSITFLNVKEIDVSACNGMMNLFSSSVAKRLVNLMLIKIHDCGGMNSIVAEVEGEEEKDEIIFNNLTELHIIHLSSLVSFYSGKCMLKFPSLTELIIDGCPKMKTFSYGVISTPILHSMKIEGTKLRVSPVCSINVSIQNLFAQLGEDSEGN